MRRRRAKASGEDPGANREELDHLESVLNTMSAFMVDLAIKQYPGHPVVLQWDAERNLVVATFREHRAERKALAAALNELSLEISVGEGGTDFRPVPTNVTFFCIGGGEPARTAEIPLD